MLLIDCHEPKSIIENLRSSIPVKVLRLKYGDYSFSDIIIERKTLSDFFSSLKNNRLEENAENINRYYTEKYLLVEGLYDFSYVNDVRYLYSRLFNITLNFDIRIIFSKDAEHTITLIKKLYFRKNLGYTTNAIKKDRIHHAVNLFGIHGKRLEALFQKFGSISNIANADKSEFKGIKSIGKNTIKKIKEVLESNIFEG